MYLFSIFLFGRPSVTLARLSPLAAAVSPENAGLDGRASAAATSAAAGLAGAYAQQRGDDPADHLAEERITDHDDR